ncbi:MAG: HAMP domain-containing protein [Anaerolineales bacterium]|nr:HAMP domain-containing protein [Anaerolineales bacterium]
MNRLWVQFSLAITLAIILVSLSPGALILLENWLNPPILLEDETGLPPTLTPAEVDHLLETLAELGIRPLKVDLYPNGYFSVQTSSTSLTEALTQVETIIKVLSSEQIGKLDIYFENFGTAEDPPLQTYLSINGRIPLTKMDIFAQRFPPGEIEVFNDSFLGENPSIIETLQLFSEEILRAIIVGLVLGVGLGIWLSRTLTAPLRHLADAARVIGARDLSYRVKVKGSKEVKDLADTFNQMSANLERAERWQRQMMADVSHELRTPLTVLEGNLRAALDRVARLDEQNSGRPVQPDPSPDSAGE